MTSVRRAVVAAATLTLATIVGCAPKPAPAPAAPAAATADQIEVARAANLAIGDRHVGTVEAINERFAAVSGIETTAVQKGDTLTFLDVPSNRVVGIGTLSEAAASGRLIVEIGPFDVRPPRVGDLCIKLK